MFINLLKKKISEELKKKELQHLKVDVKQSKKRFQHVHSDDDY